MMSPWDLVSPQARDSVDPGPFPGSRPSFLPFRCPLGCRLQDPQGPCLQSLPRSRSRSRGGALRCFTFLGGGGGQRMIFCGGGGGPPDLSPMTSNLRLRVTGPVDSLLLVCVSVSWGPEGAESLHAPLYASYLESLCPNQCIGTRACGPRPADP
ncbi:hypothetical protein NDU88_000582 [Pleurodeles waltl]|uniref:Uncharacterized protein n=1 Tax=Pleurodeles waltl TaxID=8319 RepID=A0AAV7URG3_PLEWA|nr:hypothetical protein NDU88_000582 [Pleurodeles waltl]